MASGVRKKSSGFDSAFLHEKRAAAYEIGELFREGKGFRVYRAVEKSLRAECFLHQFDVPADASEDDRQRAMTAVKRYALLLQPRTPHVVDAWSNETTLSVAEFKQSGAVFTTDPTNPVRAGTSQRRGEIFERTLRLLTGLHSCDIVHGAVRPEAFALYNNHEILMVDSGIDEKVARVLRRASAADDVYSLSANMQGRDVAAWALPIVPVDPYDDWDDFHLRDAETRLKEIFRSAPVVEFFMQAISAAARKEGAFEGALAALRAFQKADLGGHLS